MTQRAALIIGKPARMRTGLVMLDSSKGLAWTEVTGQ